MPLTVLKIGQLCLDFFHVSNITTNDLPFSYTEFEKMLGQMSQLAATYLIRTLSKYLSIIP